MDSVADPAPALACSGRSDLEQEVCELAQQADGKLAGLLSGLSYAGPAAQAEASSLFTNPLASISPP